MIKKLCIYYLGEKKQNKRDSENMEDFSIYESCLDYS